MSLDSIHPLLPHGNALWKPDAAFQQRVDYPYKKAVIAMPSRGGATERSGAVAVRNGATERKPRMNDIYTTLLPYFDEMSPLYPPDMRTAAERHLRNRMMVFAADVGLKVLGLPSTQPLDHATIVRLASYLLDTDMEQKLKAA